MFAHGSPAARLKAAFVAAVSTAIAVGRAIANRRRVLPLLDLSDRELRDIGLTRDDLQTALARPLARDPSIVLMVRAVDRRSRLAECPATAGRYRVREPAV